MQALFDDSDEEEQQPQEARPVAAAGKAKGRPFRRFGSTENAEAPASPNDAPQQGSPQETSAPQAHAAPQAASPPAGAPSGDVATAPSFLNQPSAEPFPMPTAQSAAAPVAVQAAPAVVAEPVAAPPAEVRPRTPDPVFVMPDRPTLPAVPKVEIKPLGSLVIPPMLEATPPPAPQMLPGTFQKDAASWDAFVELRKQLEESHTRTLALHGEISRGQVTHEAEASALETTVQEQLATQRKELEEVTEHYNSATAKNDHLAALLARKAEDLMKMEQALHKAQCEHAIMVQKVKHVEDRVRLADNARQVSEVRTRELELSLEHATTLITSLRAQLSTSNDDKNAALQEQHQLFEANRQQLIVFYSEREQYVLGTFNSSLADVQNSMQHHLKERELHVEKRWEETFRVQFEHQRLLQKELQERVAVHESETRAMREGQEQEKERWLAHMQREVRLADERAHEREQHVLVDIARRERELGEREQRMRVQNVQIEQDAKIQMLSKEAEMKAAYEKDVNDIRDTSERDRERMVTSFREQVASIASQHLNNERDLERLHREKEREMAQRYRIAGYDMDDDKSRSDLDRVATKTQSSLMSKFDAMEQRQKGRATAQRTKLSDGNLASPTTSSYTTRAVAADDATPDAAAPSADAPSPDGE
jgi:hypothetical protein